MYYQGKYFFLEHFGVIMAEQDMNYNLKGFLSFWLLQVISELGTAIGTFSIIL